MKYKAIKRFCCNKSPHVTPAAIKKCAHLQISQQNTQREICHCLRDFFFDFVKINNFQHVAIIIDE